MSILTACGGNGGSGAGTVGEPGGGVGTLSLGLIDAPFQDVKAVYVTVDEVLAHEDGGRWTTVADPDRTVNLLELVNGVRAQLGLTQLGAGRYTQLRMIIGLAPDDGLNLHAKKHPYANYVVDESDAYHPLKVPSGVQSGIKVVHGFTIQPGVITELVLDFDAARSVVKAGNSGKWLLKPRLKVLEIKAAALVGGLVTPVDRNGARVTAQVFDPSAADPRDRVIVESGTTTDAGGLYTLFVSPDRYNLVARKAGHRTDCVTVDAARGGAFRENFALSGIASGFVTGQVVVGGADPEVHVTLSFRQSAICRKSTIRQDIEVESVNVANTARYVQPLPIGSYRVVAWTSGRRTQERVVKVEAGKRTVVDFVF